MKDVLTEIVEHKRLELEEAKIAKPAYLLEREIA